MGAGLQEAETMGWGGSGDDDDAEDEGAGIIPRGWESTRAGAPVSEGRDWAGIEDGEWRGELSRYSHLPRAHSATKTDPPSSLLVHLQVPTNSSITEPSSTSSPFFRPVAETLFLLTR